jgi:hypothetical protein
VNFKDARFVNLGRFQRKAGPDPSRNFSQNIVRLFVFVWVILCCITDTTNPGNALRDAVKWNKSEKT